MPTEQYNDKGELRCEHTFEDGMCVDCFCPQTPADTDKAIAALYKHEAKEN